MSDKLIAALRAFVFRDVEDGELVEPPGGGLVTAQLAQKGEAHGPVARLAGRKGFAGGERHLERQGMCRMLDAVYPGAQDAVSGREIRMATISQLRGPSREQVEWLKGSSRSRRALEKHRVAMREIVTRANAASPSAMCKKTQGKCGCGNSASGRNYTTRAAGHLYKFLISSSKPCR